MVAIWGANFSLVKVAMRDFPELAFNAFRLVIASAIFLGALGTGGTQIGDLDALAAEAMRNGKDLGSVFEVVFAAASITLAIAYVGLIFMKELPLKGRQ